MKAWVVQIGEPLPLDAGARWMRSGLLARELASRGHEVTWWASAFDHYRRSWVDPSLDSNILMDNLTLRLLRGWGYSANLSLRRLVDHAKVARAFAKAAEQAAQPDIIVAALPDYRIAHAAFRYAQQRGIPFVLDLRDRWPWDFLDHLPNAMRPLGRLALAADFTLARRLIAESDSLVTMMETWDRWIAREGGRMPRAADRVFYLGAERLKPDADRIGAPVRAALEQSEGRWPILFVGAFTNRSWPKQAVEAFKLLPETKAGPRPLLILAGDGDCRPQLEELIGDSSDILLPGFVNDAEIAALLGVAKVGLTTLNGDYEAVPNKVFTYLSGGLPILSSIGGELDALLAREEVGLTCLTPAEMADALAMLMQDETRRATMARRARALFDERYEAARLYGAYADHLEALASVPA